MARTVVSSIADKTEILLENALSLPEGVYHFCPSLPKPRALNASVHRRMDANRRLGMQVASRGSGQPIGERAVIPRKLKDWALLVGITALWCTWFAVGQVLRGLV